MKVVRVILKQIMEERGITQSQLSRDTKIAPNTVKSYYHNNVRRSDLEIIAKFCEYLDCDICDIMMLEDSKS